MLLATVGGIGYTYYSDQNSTTKPIATAAAAPEIQEPTITRAAPTPNTPVGVSIEAIDSMVVVNTQASVSVRTTRGAACMIKVLYNKVPAHDSGLVPKTADDFGNVTWTWLVGADTPPGMWPVTITCALNGKSGVVQGNLDVTASGGLQSTTAGN